MSRGVLRQGLTQACLSGALALGVGCAWAAQASAAGAPGAPSGIHLVESTRLSVTLGWSAVAAADGYRLYRSGVPLAETIGNHSTWGHLNCDSTYRFSVQAYNERGASRRVDYYASTAPCGSRDGIAPTRPSRLIARAATKTGLIISWEPSTDTVGVAGYEIYVNGAKVGSSSTHRYEVRGLACATRYRLSVGAYDAAGNRSARMSVVGWTSTCKPTAIGRAQTPQPWSGAAGLYVSPAGSDSGACKQAAPCRSFDRAFHLAKSGSRVLLMSGDYGGQSLTYNTALVGASRKVVFQPAPGATARMSGELSLRADAGKPIANVEFDNLTIDDIYVRYVEHVTFRNVANTYFFVRSSTGVSFVGGSSGGDHYGNSDTIGSIGSGTPASTRILIDGVRFHDFNNDLSPDTHTECLFIQESSGVTIRNSTFTNCRDFDVYANVLFGGSITNVTLQGNRLGKTAPAGYYAFRANVGAYLFRGNSWGQGMANDRPVSAIGCGNRLDSRGFAMPVALLRPC